MNLLSRPVELTTERNITAVEQRGQEKLLGIFVEKSGSLEFRAENKARLEVMSEKIYIYGVVGQSGLFLREGQINRYELTRGRLLRETL